jgi:hypothetical protein
MAALPAGAGVVGVRLQAWLASGLDFTQVVILSLGGFLTASAVTLTALRGRWDALARGLRPVLDVVLDVDNHLRDFPARATPRARIGARFASLLRYLCQWTDPRADKDANEDKEDGHGEDGEGEGGRKEGGKGGGYDALILVAHSQGGVITAELLRFLRYQAQRQAPGVDKKDAFLDPSLARLIPGTPENGAIPLPVYLFTMGCPLRQLYHLRFPHLYAWAGDPDPEALGVVFWVNAYRSGDYVGRYLWRGEAGAPWSEATYAGPRRKEYCVGAGAHTHYWDGTAPQVARELDALIEQASAEGEIQREDRASQSSPERQEPSARHRQSHQQAT